MNKSLIDVEYVDQFGYNNARLHMKVLPIGDALFMSPNGQNISFKVTYKQAKSLLNYLLTISTKRTNNNQYSFPLSLSLNILNAGKYQIDSEIAIEFVGAFTSIVADNEIGSLLAQYQTN